MKYHKFARTCNEKVIKLIVCGNRKIKRSDPRSGLEDGEEEQTWVFTLNGANPSFSSDKAERKLFKSNKLCTNSTYQLRKTVNYLGKQRNVFFFHS